MSLFCTFVLRVHVIGTRPTFAGHAAVPELVLLHGVWGGHQCCTSNNTMRKPLPAAVSETEPAAAFLDTLAQRVPGVTVLVFYRGAW